MGEDWRSKEEAQGGRWAKGGQCNVPGATSQDESRAGETCRCCLSHPHRHSLTFSKGNWHQIGSINLWKGLQMEINKQLHNVVQTQCILICKWKIHANKTNQLQTPNVLIAPNTDRAAGTDGSVTSCALIRKLVALFSYETRRNDAAFFFLNRAYFFKAYLVPFFWAAVMKKCN